MVDSFKPQVPPNTSPANIDTRSKGEINETPNIVIGTVLRAGGGTYDVEVSVLSFPKPVTCTVMSSTSASFFGTSECSLPPAGSKVLVLLTGSDNKSGVVIGVYPEANRGPMGEPRPTNNTLIDLEGSASVATEAAYQIPAEDEQYATRVDASAGRYLDLVPGNKAWFNEQGVAVSILNLMLLLRATDRAQLQFGVLDDMVRLITGYWHHISAQGSEQVYNDGGYLTRELGVSIYQWERSGFLELGSPAFVPGDDKVLDASLKTRYEHTEKLATSSRKRLQCFTGHLGDIMNMFVANPDPNIDVDTVDQKAKDQGLLHTHVDTSGRVTVRSAAGISFQRSDRIPVPKRMYQPWDPKGDKIEQENGESATTKPPYQFTDTCSRSMQMRDANAYRNAQAYAKIDKRKKDFYLPEENELETPKDEYDAQSWGTEDFEKNKNRQSYFNLEDDGSIVIRDAWGSEIIMRGGNIIITCAGNLELRPGKSIVQLAGDDAVIKARNSIDITATNKDVRVKANVNLHMLSEGRDGIGGGVLIESKSAYPGSSYSGTGEAVFSQGITFKAADSSILTTASEIHQAASRVFRFDGFKVEDGKPVATANMYIGGINQFNCAVSEYATIGVSDKSALTIQPGLAIMAASNAILCGGSTAQVLENATAWVPLDKADLDSGSYYDELQRSTFKDNKKTYLDGTDWLGAYPPVQRDTIGFTYRSSQECNTIQASEVEGGTEFAMYQPGWAYLADAGSKLVPVSLTAWTEYAIKDTYPWPGADAYNGNTYMTLRAEKYIGDPATGIAVNRSVALNSEGASIAPVPKAFSAYEVVNVI